jgi:hypothetical protein
MRRTTEGVFRFGLRRLRRKRLGALHKASIGKQFHKVFAILDTIL